MQKSRLDYFTFRPSLTSSYHYYHYYFYCQHYLGPQCHLPTPVR